MKLGELFEAHRRIALDSNVLIYLLEANEPIAEIARALVDGIEEGRTRAVLSVVGLAEVLTGPARTGDLGRLERYDAEIRAIEGLRVCAFQPEAAADVAVIRGMRGITLPDAIHLASARAAGATAFVTNDRRLRGSAHLEVVYLDDLVPDQQAM